MTEKVKRKITPKDVIIATLMGLLLIAVFFGANYAINNLVSQPIMKEAIEKRDLDPTVDYIICTPTNDPALPWQVVEDNQGNKIGQPAIIVGFDPRTDMGLKNNFLEAKNKYVFYIEDSETLSTEDQTQYLQYTATNWDILRKIKRAGMFSGMQSGKYILRGDTEDSEKFLQFESNLGNTPVEQ